VILGGLAANTGFSAAEIDTFDAETALYWWGALASYNEAVENTK
jgi:hypothetical protein